MNHEQQSQTEEVSRIEQTDQMGRNDMLQENKIIHASKGMLNSKLQLNNTTSPKFSVSGPHSRKSPLLSPSFDSGVKQDAMMETIDMLIDARMEMKFKSFNQHVDEFKQSYDQKLYYI